MFYCRAALLIEENVKRLWLTVASRKHAFLNLAQPDLEIQVKEIVIIDFIHMPIVTMGWVCAGEIKISQIV